MAATNNCPKADASNCDHSKVPLTARSTDSSVKVLQEGLLGTSTRAFAFPMRDIDVLVPHVKRAMRRRAVRNKAGACNQLLLCANKEERAVNWRVNPSSWHS